MQVQQSSPLENTSPPAPPIRLNTGNQAWQPQSWAAATASSTLLPELARRAQPGHSL